MLQLQGFAKLPADTFAEGPPSGQYNSDGSLKPEPPFLDNLFKVLVQFNLLMRILFGFFQIMALVIS